MCTAFRFSRFFYSFLGIWVIALAAPGADLMPIPPSSQILSTLKKEHPRLLVSSNDFEQLKVRVAEEKRLHAWYVRLQKEGESLLKAPPSKYEIPDGLRLLDTSRRVLDRVQKLALLYRLDGDKRYADRAWAELDAAAHFKDWNPRHFLDTAEMTHAFAIGYDWLYDYWTPEQREELRTAIVEKGIKPALDVENKKVWWAVTSFNWNQVCNGGIGTGALAIADEEPDLAADFLSKALSSIQLAMAEYGPDGAWPEGPSYWAYATSYTVVFLASLESALGTDFGLAGINGFSETGSFPIFNNGPSDQTFNYADAHEGVVRSPVLFWLARKFNHPEYAAYEARVGGYSALDLVWYDDALANASASSPPLDKYFRHSEIVTLRSAWNDTNALFVGLKAGSNQANHSHLDLGSFVLDALGERWALDPGADNYNLPGYFNTSDKRWTYYRLRAEGHNTLVIDPTNGPDQNPKAAVKVARFDSKPERAFAITDLTPAYKAQKVERGIAMLDRRAVLVQDEVASADPADIWWFLHTTAEVTIADGGTNAVLTLHGKRLTARIVSPEPAHFELLPAEPLASSPHPSGQAVNKEIRVLGIHLTEQTALRLAVELAPVTDTGATPAIELKPLADW